jgi:hypothetical protein
MDERKKLKAKSCYGHLGGTLGNRLFECMLEQKWFERDEDKATVFTLTKAGEQALLRLGVNIYEKR